MENDVNRICIGRRNIEEAIRFAEKSNQSFPFSKVYVKSTIMDEILRTILIDAPGNLSIIPVDNNELEKISRSKNHQGIVGILNSKSKSSHSKNFKESIEPGMGPIILLDRIQDPHNMGSILRSAECLGAKHIIYPEKESCGITPIVEKVSSGAVRYLNLYKTVNLSQAVDHLKEIGYWIVSLSDRGEENWESLPNMEELVLIFGNEGEGVKRILIEKSDYLIRIPMDGSISSLNVSVSFGITLDRLRRI
jgi:23S rRNA (guanosine2251-2'-O)-methyltransferase